MTDHKQRALDLVSKCDDPKQLRQIARNARSKGEDDIWRAAQRRLYEVLPDEKPGTLEYDVWQSIYALEGELSDERSKTTRLSRTRQKISRDGVHGTVVDLVSGKGTEGFRMLIERGFPDLTFEAVAIKHADRFSDDVLQIARSKLKAAKGEDLSHETHEIAVRAAQDAENL